MTSIYGETLIDRIPAAQTALSPGALAPRLIKGTHGAMLTSFELQTGPSRRPWFAVMVVLLTLGIAQPAQAVDDEISGPGLALGAGFLAAGMVACVWPVGMEAVSIAEGERASTGLIIAGYTCSAIGLGAGMAFAFRDEPEWQRNVGIAAAVFGGVALGLTIAAHAVPAPSESSGIRFMVAPTVVSDGTGTLAPALSFGVFGF
jgi:hypothetical protein